MEYGSVRTPPRLTLRRGPDGEWDDDDEKADGRCRRCWRDRRRWRQWGGAATAACPLLRCGRQRGQAGDRDVEAEGATPPRVASAWAARDKRQKRVLWLQRCSSGVWIVLFFIAPLATFFIGRRRLVPAPPRLHPTPPRTPPSRVD